MTQEKEQANRTFGELSAGLKQLVKDREKESSENARLRQEKEQELQRVLSDKESEVVSVRSEARRLNEEIIKLQIELQEKNQECHYKSTELIAKGEEIIRLTKLSTELDYELHSMRPQLQRAEEDVNKKLALAEERSKQITVLEREVSDQNRKLSALSYVQTTNEEIKREISELKKDRELLVDQTRSLTNENASLSADLATIRRVLASATERLGSFEQLLDRNEMLERELKEKGAKLTQIHRSLDEFQSSISMDQMTNTTSLNKIKQQRDAAEKSLEQAVAEIDRLNKAIRQGKQQNEDYEKAHQDVKVHLARLTSEASSMREERDQVNRYLSSLQEQVRMLESEKVQLSSRYAESSGDSARVNAELQELRSLKQMYSDQESEVVEIKKRFEDALVQCKILKNSAVKLEEDLEKERREKAINSEALKMEREMSKSMKDTFVSKIVFESLQSDLKQSTEQASAHKVKADRLRADLERCNIEKDALRNDKFALSQQLEEAMMELRLTVAKVNRFETEIQERTSRIASIENELAIANRSLAGLDQLNLKSIMLEHAESELTQLKITVEQKSKRINELEREVLDLKGELRKERDERRAISVQQDAASSEFTRVKQQLSNLEQTHENILQEYSSCRSQLSSLKLQVLNMESKSSYKSLNYEEVLKDKAHELKQRDAMIEQLTRDCDHLMLKMQEGSNAMQYGDGVDEQVDRLLRENVHLMRELNDARDLENELREEYSRKEEEWEMMREQLRRENSHSALTEAQRTINEGLLRERQLGSRITQLDNQCQELERLLKNRKAEASRGELVYLEEAERFRIMYNDAQRELMKMREEKEARAMEQRSLIPLGEGSSTHTKNLNLADGSQLKMKLQVTMISDQNGTRMRTSEEDNFNDQN